MADRSPGRPPGGPKYGGRQAGTPNRDKLEFAQKLEEAARKLGYDGFDILQELVECYHGVKAQDKDKAASLLIRTMEYVYPKKKAVEVSGPDGGPVQIDVGPAVDVFDDLAGDG